MDPYSSYTSGYSDSTLPNVRGAFGSGTFGSGTFGVPDSLDPDNSYASGYGGGPEGGALYSSYASGYGGGPEEALYSSYTSGGYGGGPEGLPGFPVLVDTVEVVDSLSHTVTGGPPPPPPDELPRAREVLEWVAPFGATIPLIQRQGGKGRWMPPVRLVTDKVFGQPGGRVRNVTFDMANVVVPVLLNTATTDDYRTLLRSMASSLNPLAGPGLLRSTVTWADDTVEIRELVCYYTAGMDVPEDYLDVGYASLLFTAPDPFWYGATQSFAWQSPPTAVTWFPILPLNLGTSQVFKHATLSNAGDTETWPVWRITGPTTGDLTLTNNATGDVFGLAYPVPTGATITIDTRPNIKTVAGDTGNLFSYLTSPVLWPLTAGDNAVTMVLPGASAATTVAVTYRQRYLAA